MLCAERYLPAGVKPQCHAVASRGSQLRVGKQHRIRDAQQLKAQHRAEVMAETNAAYELAEKRAAPEKELASAQLEEVRARKRARQGATPQGASSSSTAAAVVDASKPVHDVLHRVDAT